MWAKHFVRFVGGPIGLRVAGAFHGYLLEIDSIDSAGFFSSYIQSIYILFYMYVYIYTYIVCFVLRVLLYRGVLRFKK